MTDEEHAAALAKRPTLKNVIAERDAFAKMVVAMRNEIMALRVYGSPAPADPRAAIVEAVLSTGEVGYSASFLIADAVLARLARSQSMPTGWVLVPREPTEAMCRAAIWALDQAKERDGKIQQRNPYTPAEKHAIRYSAMLAAAPHYGRATAGKGDAS